MLEAVGWRGPARDVAVADDDRGTPALRGGVVRMSSVIAATDEVMPSGSRTR